jgi:hypothetical protein
VEESGRRTTHELSHFGKGDIAPAFGGVQRLFPAFDLLGGDIVAGGAVKEHVGSDK